MSKTSFTSFRKTLARMVEIGAANLVDPYICRTIIETLPEAMDRYGIGTLRELIAE